MLCYFLLLVLSHNAVSSLPNIILILTDDQDYDLNSLQAMPKLKKLITDQGAEFTNMFVTTPICCPSRSSIFSGRYVHNNRAYNNSKEGGCVGDFWLSKMEPTAFPTLMKKAGYKTFYAGKYLNRYGEKASGGPEHVPPGWDWWAGLIGDNYFFKYPMSVNGSKVHHGSDPDDYLTTVIRKHAREFFKWTDVNTPIFMVLAATAPHTPADSIPPYTKLFSNLSAPRTPHFGKYSPDKHWLIRHLPKELPDDIIAIVDELFRKRWRSLQSVDDMVEEVYGVVQRRGQLDNTYIMYTSDNGFQLAMLTHIPGQFNLPWDKRQLYEFDVRVPMIVKGPGIAAGSTHAEPVLNIDIAPTLLSLSGIPIPTYFEGMSFKKLLSSRSSFGDDPSEWRRSFLIEYYGINDQNDRCGDPNLGACLPHCICVDARNNTYSCVRTLTRTVNEAYCEMVDDVAFKEYYDLNKDPYQLANAIKGVPKPKLHTLQKLLRELKSCSGKACRIF